VEKSVGKVQNFGDLVPQPTRDLRRIVSKTSQNMRLLWHIVAKKGELRVNEVAKLFAFNNLVF